MVGECIAATATTTAASTGTKAKPPSMDQIADGSTIIIASAAVAAIAIACRISYTTIPWLIWSSSTHDPP